MPVTYKKQVDKEYDIERCVLIGSYIRKHCRLQNISIRVLAEALNVNFGNFSNFVKGSKPMPPRLLNRVKVILPTLAYDGALQADEMALTEKFYPADKAKYEETLKLHQERISKTQRGSQFKASE